ncbi:MAG: glycosyltransferase family 2 protein [Chloroflexota bacterium]
MSADTRPLVSLVTPTWQRHDLLIETIEHVRDQDYPDLEHIIVADGTDEQLARWATQGWPTAFGDPTAVPIRFAELGRHWSGLMPKPALGVAPILTGLLMARGDYLAWLCDDERFMQPDSLRLLVDHLESTGADFVYPKVRMYWNGQQPADGWDIGTDPPQYGQFTWCLFRAELLQTAMPRFDAPVWNDWYLISKWVEAGATWAFLPEVTFSHRADR